MELDFPVPGRAIEETSYNTQKQQILIRVRELCGWKRATFPGSQPVSLSNTNISELGRVPYVACEKTDGARYLLFAASAKVFLIDRKETVRVLELCLPKSQRGLDQEGELEVDEMGRPVLERHQVTLLDGELVQDEFSDGCKKVSFLVYDAICVERDVSIAKNNLMERLRAALVEVVRPRHSYVEKFPAAIEHEVATNNFMPIYLKDFFEVWDIMAIRNYSSKRLPHLCDGIIFTPVAAPYVPGTCKGLIKWKPPELNTVDFASDLLYGWDIDGLKVPIAARLLIGHRGFRADSGCWIAIGEGKIWDKMIAREMQYNDCDGAIWECYFDPKAVTIVPSVALTDAEKVRARKIHETWKSFWAKKSGDKRKNCEDTVEEPVSKKKRVVRQVVDSMADEFSAGEVSGDIHPKMGRLPLTNLPKFPEHVCPVLQDKAGQTFYDYSTAELLPGAWVLERVRTDKSTPNDERVMQRVQESIDAGIDYTQLFNTLLSYRKSGVKAVHALCEMPIYYAEHGSRTQTEDTEIYEKQAAAAQAAVAAAFASIQEKSQQQRTVAPQVDLEAAMLDELAAAPAPTTITPPASIAQHLPPKQQQPQRPEVPLQAKEDDDDDDDEDDDDDSSDGRRISSSSESEDD